MTASASAELEPAEPRNAWDRHPDEPSQVYGYFRAYLLMGRGHRSLRVLSQQTGIDRSTLGVHSRRWRWVERCDAYDADLDAVEDNELRQAKRRMARDVIRNADASLAAASDVLRAAIKNLHDIAEGTRYAGLNDQGERVPLDLTFEEALAGLRIAARVTQQVHVIIGRPDDDTDDMPDPEDLGHGLSTPELAVAFLQLVGHLPVESAPDTIPADAYGTGTIIDATAADTTPAPAEAVLVIEDEVTIGPDPTDGPAVP